MRIYLAGPLFSEGDIAQRIKEAAALRELGFEVYNPIEAPFNDDKSTLPTALDIFYGDFNQLKQCDLIVADVTHDDPGMYAELGIAWHLGLPIVSYNSDIRLNDASRYSIPSFGMNHFVLGLLTCENNRMFTSFKDVLRFLEKNQ